MSSLASKWVLAFFLAFAAHGAAWAQAFPSKPVTLIVPFTAGGTNDILARLLQEPMSRALGQPVVIENRPGAGGAIGARHALQSRDGHAVLFTNSSLVTTSLVQQGAGYDPLTDFRPVVMVSSTPLLLMAHPAVPFNDLSGLIAHAKAHPGQIEYAVAGPGSFAHLAIESLSQTAGIRMLRVIYPGAAQTTAAVLSGEVKIQLQTPSDTIGQHVRAGRIKAIAVSSRDESPIAPGVAPIARTLPGFEAEAWFGMLVSSGTPEPIARRLNEVVNTALQEPAVRARIQELGMAVRGGGETLFADGLRQERDGFRKVLDTPGFSLN